MDLHKLTHSNFRRNVFGVVFVSVIVVASAALLGRGIINIYGALTVIEPTDLTVTRLLEPFELFPSEVFDLPERDNGEWNYSVRMRNGETYFVRISKEGPPWKLVTRPERLHE